METLCQSIMSEEETGETTMKCGICGREATSSLCKYHEEAREQVNSGYQKWVRAYGQIEMKDYLDKVKRNDHTGQWAKEIAEMVLEGLRE